MLLMLISMKILSIMLLLIKYNLIKPSNDYDIRELV